MPDAPDPLVDAFVTQLPAPAEGTTPRALGDALRRLWRAGRAGWPNIELSVERFVALLAPRVAPDRPITESLAAVRAEEVYLACACSAGDSNAIAVLEDKYGAHLADVVRRFSHPDLHREDLRQIVRERLFAAHGDQPPAIARYGGTGSLAAWLRITARRALLNAVRKQPAAGSDSGEELDEIEALTSALRDPEIAYLKSAYRAAFKDAFAAAVPRLEDRARVLLCEAVVHNVTVRDLGRAYRVHYATASRWLADARGQLVRLTREELTARLKVGSDELDSIMALIESRLDVSVERILGD